MNGSFKIREYTETGRSPFAEWFNKLDAVTAERVDRYILRLEAGNFSASKPLREGVFELRMDFGPGYRLYFGREGRTLIILAPSQAWPTGSNSSDDLKTWTTAGRREQTAAGGGHRRRRGTLETYKEART